MTKTRSLVALAVAALAGWAVSPLALQRASPAAPAALPALVVQPLTSPAGANSSGPQLIVTKERAVLSWLEGAGPKATLKFSDKTPAGWSAARTAFAGSAMIVNSADVPSVRYLSDGTLVAAWTEENGIDPEASTLRLSWSKDAGRTWSPPVSPYAEKSQQQHGFASLFEAPGGGFGVIWIDGRALETSEDMALRARVYLADGKPAGAEMVVDSRVCECCSTAVASTTAGVIAAFRNRGSDETRDISVSRLVAGKWAAPALVHKDGWVIEACPVNGPAVSAAGNDVAVGWFTAPDDQGRAFAAFSRDGGVTFGAPVRLDDASSLGRVQVAMLPDGSAAAGWIEFVQKASQFRVRRIDRNGGRSAPATIAAGTGSQQPRIAQVGGELLLAWTENSQGVSRVRTAKAALK